MEIKVNSMYRSKDGVVVIVTKLDGHLIEYEFINKDKNNSFSIGQDSFKIFYPEELILPEPGDKIYLTKNRINDNSPYSNRTWTVLSTCKIGVSLRSEYGEKIIIDLTNWEWKVIKNSIDIPNTNVLKCSTQNKGHKTMEIKVNAMYRSKDGEVVKVTDVGPTRVYYDYIGDNTKSFSWSSKNEFVHFYPEEIILPKCGDRIYLTKNRINDNSPHVNKTWTVVSAPSTWVTIQSDSGELLNIDLFNWEWNVVKDAPVEHDGLIEKDGKFYVLTEIEQPKYKIGDIVDGNLVVVDMKPSTQGWEYHMWNRTQSQINFVRKI